MSELESTGLTKIVLKPAGVEPFLVFMSNATEIKIGYFKATIEMLPIAPGSQIDSPKVTKVTPLPANATPVQVTTYANFLEKVAAKQYAMAHLSW